ncbi:hypothetical protein T10_1528 [Trichinella papuae]|uniref:Uncharacterized protein n=1 Tax=Trichinella papuae TaxID=268474 RepID=A0A0V1LY77_9BILA|nr:hypothetical protein T10_1528 [Trichinella papuae]
MKNDHFVCPWKHMKLPKLVAQLVSNAIQTTCEQPIKNKRLKLWEQMMKKRFPTWDTLHQTTSC